MAAAPFDIPGPGTSYAFDIYNDAHAARAPGPALPGGPCNYTDQNLPRCGCRRFWSRASLSSGVFQDSGALAEICMCSHHACFHEDVQPAQAQQPATGVAPGQENQRPRTNREPLSPVQLPSFHVPGSLGSSLDFSLLDFHQASVAANPTPVEGARAGQDSPLPDTFNNWGDLNRSQPGHVNGLPPFPAQCLMSPPPPPSTAASSQARYLRPFAGKGLHTLSGVSAFRPESRQLERGGSRESAEAVPDAAHAPTEAASTPQALPSQDRSVSGPDGYHKLADRLDTHDQRLDRLETDSFSVAGHEDCHDRHESIDLRVTDLESRVEEVEKILNDNGSVVSGRRTAKRDGGADDATASVVSVSTNATVTAANRAEVYSQLQQLQAQVSQLQATAMPSYAKPWELEVVFLPFPLKGVWLEAREFPAHRRSTGSNGDDWTQMPNTISRATPDPQSPQFQEWAGQGQESNWLLPRAFAAGRVIDQRLRSRGLIKTVLVRGPDARSVQLAIHSAFEDILRISSNSDARSGTAPDYPLAKYLGLRQAWVPLRKLHKDSRLRLLSPAEMATPALWDFTFLVSSVVMKATGVQRLYITQPEAYLQDHPLGYHALEAGWTWQKLRQLSRVYPDTQSTADVPEADALEEYWNWNDRLDEPPSMSTSSISLRQSMHQRVSRRSSTEPSTVFYTGMQSPMGVAGPSRSRAQSPLIQREPRSPWPPHIRTGSLPPVGPGMLSPAQSRRRVSSHAPSMTPYERRSSPFVPRASPRPSPRLGTNAINIPSAAGAVPKRRFPSRSPSLIPRNTPRWSRTSMSRSPSLAPGGLYGHHEDVNHHNNNNRERRTTPLYYATPHSEAVPEYGYHRGGSRGPVLRGVGNGYDAEEEEDEEMDDSFTDESTGSGSGSTDAGLEDDGDSQMAGLHHHHNHSAAGSARRPRRNNVNGSFGFATTTDENGGDDADLDIYQDEQEDDELDGVDTDADGNHPDSQDGAGGGQQQQQQQQQQPLRPEDIPWQGIEDIAPTIPTTTTTSAAGRGIRDGDGDSEMSEDCENIDPTSQSSLSSLSLSSSSSSAAAAAAGGGSQSRSQGVVIHRAEHEHEIDAVLHQQIRPHQQGQQQQPSQPQPQRQQQQQRDREREEEYDDGASSTSQAPSEYSSKRGAWQVISLGGGGGGGVEDVGVAALQQQQQAEGEPLGSEDFGMGFRIHEDGTAGGEEPGEDLLDTQWG
ncbi:hypothetical protein N658DRAFT_417795 [Parathielavia hyrcaniae]|uniref:Uncharacterized protein n=1 Tax=Parathielavia hyrcaniae TaxID=113614 RepID=A0AAN6Q943_9PEZI|nr:hypothetical protein N658DRAFT_417795 [Parathielavia hyrcaniae]